MKRYISIFAALIVMLALCSCGADSSKPTGDTVTSGDLIETTTSQAITTTSNKQDKTTTSKKKKTTTSSKKKRTTTTSNKPIETTTLREEEGKTTQEETENTTEVVTEVSTTQETTTTESTTSLDSDKDDNRAETSFWDGSSALRWTNGSGTAGDPYLIESAANLAYLALTTTTEDTYFSLTVNINLGYFEWTPIGTKTNPFCANFDGNGHIISAVNLSKSHFNTSGEYGYERRGLFGHTKNCTIKNLSVDGVKSHIDSISSYTDVYYIGGLIGYAQTDYESIVENCHVENVLIEFETSECPTVYVGGLVGYAHSEQNATLKFSRVAVGAKAEVCSEGSNRIGGVVGYVYLNGIANFSDVCSYFENLQGRSSSSDGEYRVSPLIGAVKTDMGSLNLSSCYLSLYTNEEHFSIHSASGYDSEAHACVGRVYGKFEGKSKFTNVFATALIETWAGGVSEGFPFFPLPIKEYRNLTVSNYGIVSVLPKTCGFDESIWDLSKMWQPKLKK